MLPLTLPALLAAATPLVPLEACPICVTIPPTCTRTTKHGETYDGLAPAVRELRELFGPITGWKGSIDQCPTCHRLYHCESGYEYLADGSEDYTTYDRIDDVEALFHSDWFTRVRVDAAELPQGHRRVRKIAPRTFFRRHCIVLVELDYGRKRVWLALPDDGAPVILSGDREALARIEIDDPPMNRAEYPAFADEITKP